MSLEPALLAFPALVCLMAAMPKHRSLLAAFRLLSPRASRRLGWGLLTISAMTAVLREGLAFGLVAWLGQLSLAGAVLVLLSSGLAARAGKRPTANARPVGGPKAVRGR